MSDQGYRMGRALWGVVASRLRHPLVAFRVWRALGKPLLFPAIVAIIWSWIWALLPTANVRDFGAAGDGQTDDSEAFGRAVESLRRWWGGGGTIMVPRPALAYRISRTVTFVGLRAVKVLGTKHPELRGPCDGALMSFNCRHVHVENMHFNGAGDGVAIGTLSRETAR